MSQPILWNDFQPGAGLGEITQVFEPALSRAWQGIFGAEGAGTAAEGASIAVALMMRGYLAVVTPRPPGNVHARQRFTLEAAPVQGEAIRTVVSCLGKELKRERRYLDLGVRGTGTGGRPIYSGVLTLIWAA
jgi:hypothetical protein